MSKENPTTAATLSTATAAATPPAGCKAAPGACGCMKSAAAPAQAEDREIAGFADKNLPEPTRFGDWEVNGRCSDF